MTSTAVNVGIGSTAPAERLTVQGPSASTYAAGYSAIGLYTGFGGLNSSGAEAVVNRINMGSGYGPYIQSVIPNNGYADNIRLDLCTNAGSNNSTAVPRLTIVGGAAVNAGNVGIGTANPNALLHAHGSGYPGVLVSDSAGSVVLMRDQPNNVNILRSYGGRIDIEAPANYKRMTIIETGYVGIGITNPGVPLQVQGYVNLSPTGNWISGSSVSSNAQFVGFPVSIVSNYGIWVQNYTILVSSDERMKKDIKPARDVLRSISEIEVVGYSHIDRESGPDVAYGVVAQQIGPHVPACVSRQRNFIPCVYLDGSHDEISSTVVRVYSNFTHPDIKVGTKLRIYVMKEKRETKEVTIQSFSDRHADCEKWEDYSPEDKIFVFGVEVDDFMTVDKEQLGVLALGGVKELLVVVEDLTAKSEAQSREISELKRLVRSLLG